ncbi:hypothetical protein H0H93_005695 [Arthromyces matolae]|nr:hypothetical protein H0H93_005695 [Arthromyces matolae]
MPVTRSQSKTKQLNQLKAISSSTDWESLLALSSPAAVAARKKHDQAARRLFSDQMTATSKLRKLKEDRQRKLDQGGTDNGEVEKYMNTTSFKRLLALSSPAAMSTQKEADDASIRLFRQQMAAVQAIQEWKEARTAESERNETFEDSDNDDLDPMLETSKRTFARPLVEGQQFFHFPPAPVFLTPFLRFNQSIRLELNTAAKRT